MAVRGLPDPTENICIYLYKCSRAGPQRSQCHPALTGLSLKMAQKGSKKRKKAQKGSKRRSKRLFEPARCRQCARRGCSSLLRCRLCVRRGCSSLLFKITVRKGWTRLICIYIYMGAYQNCRLTRIMYSRPFSSDVHQTCINPSRTDRGSSFFLVGRRRNNL